MTKKLIEKATKLGLRLIERTELSAVARVDRQVRRADLDHQQGDRDREHRVGKEDQPFERGSTFTSI